MKAKRILIFNPFGIGDVLFSTPLIRNLKESAEAVYIAYLVAPRSQKVIFDNPQIDKIFIFDKDYWRALVRKSPIKFIKSLLSFFYEIKKERFDVIFDLSLNGQYGAFFLAAGIKKRIGYNFKGRGRFLTDKIDIVQAYKDKHVADYYLDLLKFLDITPKRYEFDLTVPSQVLNHVKNLLVSKDVDKNKKVIAICPGSGDSWGKTAYFKRWPQDKFLELSLRLKEAGHEVILLGSANEVEVANYIYLNLPNKPVNLCGKVTSQEFFGLIASCDLVVTNDGGPFHVAQALLKKAVVFFGPVDEKVYGQYPDGRKSLVLTKSVDCRPCYSCFKFPDCRYDKRCLREITVLEAFEACCKLLD